MIRTLMITSNKEPCESYPHFKLIIGAGDQNLLTGTK